MDNTAIVIGATGLVGRSVTDQLADADHIHKIITLTRRPAGHSCSKVYNQVVRHYLVFSSIANIDSRNPYLQMKGELEESVLSLPINRISIFQPSLLLGQRAEFRIGEKLGSWILPVLCAIPGLRSFRPISGGQVAAKMVQVSQQAGPALERFRLDEIFIK